jgi:hypothetical protein
VDFDVDDVEATAFGAAPVVRSDCPTDESVDVVPEVDARLDDVPEVGEMPLMVRLYHALSRPCLGRKRR